MTDSHQYHTCLVEFTERINTLAAMVENGQIDELNQLLQEHENATLTLNDDGNITGYRENGPRMPPWAPRYRADRDLIWWMTNHARDEHRRCVQR